MIVALEPVVMGFTAVAAAGFGVIAYVVIGLVNEKQPVEAGVKVSRGSHRRFDDAFDGSPMLRRAIEVTANLAERRGVLGSVERSLRAADIPMRPAEVLFAYGLLAVIVPLASVMLLRSPKLIILSLFVFVLLPPLALKIVQPAS